MAAVVRAGQTSLGFWLLSCTFVFQSAAVPGRRFSNSPTSQSPVRWRQPQKKNWTKTVNNKNMKKLFKPLVLVCFLTFTANTLLAQDPRETEIRRLENAEREAVLKGDTTVLFKQLWSPNMVVNAPANRVGTVEITKIHTRKGLLNYASFERNIEKITFNENLAIVMGEEKLKPQGLSDNAGKLITRRFTNIWKFSNNSWSIIARQATIIKVE
jgi:hypothetical protein